MLERRRLLAFGSALLVFGAVATASASPRCPSDMTAVGETCVDRFEASLVEIDERGHELGAWSAYVSPAGHIVKAVSRAGAVPQAHVSWYEARAACMNAGKRLCKAEEWVSACKGPDHTRYPYGDARVPHACVDTGRTAPLSKLYPTAAMYSESAMNDPRLNQTPNTVARTGEAAQCTNGYGVHDMVGNVHEWADDGAFHGGYYLDTRINREGCDYVTTAHARIYHDYSIGFRCCADGDAVAEEHAAISRDPEWYAKVAQIALGVDFDDRIATR
ncbi:MAG: SUMF1/EgtB/PvdO family nonheme iron enzyme [Deltaproteobacteria bacterium]|nr:SUMF1/EgtB/PvdO family nonheme iron enzyme [Deltaproteobacteria bacterium]